MGARGVLEEEVGSRKEGGCMLVVTGVDWKAVAAGVGCWLLLVNMLGGVAPLLTYRDNPPARRRPGVRLVNVSDA